MKQTFDIPFTDDDVLQVWSEWEQHRKEKKQKLTPMSVKKQLKFLHGRSSKEIIEIIEQSIRNGWTGLFEIKGNGKQQTSNKHQQHTSGLAASFTETYGSVLGGGKTG